MTLDHSNNPQDSHSFGSRYQLKEKVGAGGMGSVYLGYDAVLDKTVAIKHLHSALDSDTVVRFHNEARTVAKLDHPNILKVLDFGESADGSIYLVMSYIEGMSLLELVKQEGPLSPEFTISVFEQVCFGLAHAHSQNILHRDLKPSNVMLEDTKEGSYNVKIVDFGLAKLETEEQRLTRTGMRVGSPLYMSPEQARGDSIDARSDVYGVGASMFKVLTGEAPFLGETYMETLEMKTEQEAPRLNEVGDGFSAELEDLVARALAMKAEDRFQSIGELQEALHSLSARFASDQSVATHARHDQQDSAKGKRNTLLVATFVMVFSIVAAGIVSLQLAKTPTLEKPSKPPSELAKQSLDVLGTRFSREYGRTWLVVSSQTAPDEIVARLSDRNIDALRVTDSKFDDSSLSKLTKLPIELLELRGTAINENGSRLICQMHSLRSLILDDTKNITANGLTDIADLHLEVLSLRNCGITDDIVKRVCEVKTIARLDVSKNPKLSGKSLDSITHLPMLTHLMIGSTGITGRDLTRLKSRPLEFLSLDNLSLEDSHLAGLVRLRPHGVDLSNNKKLSDRGLLRLSRCKGLETVWLFGCSRISEEGIERFLDTQDSEIWNEVTASESSQEAGRIMTTFWRDPDADWHDAFREIEKIEGRRFATYGLQIEKMRMLMLDSDLTELFDDSEVIDFICKPENWRVWSKKDMSRLGKYGKNKNVRRLIRSDDFIKLARDPHIKELVSQPWFERETRRRARWMQEGSIDELHSGRHLAGHGLASERGFDHEEFRSSFMLLKEMRDDKSLKGVFSDPQVLRFLSDPDNWRLWKKDDFPELEEYRYNVNVRKVIRNRHFIQLAKGEEHRELIEQPWFGRMLQGFLHYGKGDMMMMMMKQR